MIPAIFIAALGVPLMSIVPVILEIVAIIAPSPPPPSIPPSRPPPPLPPSLSPPRPSPFPQSEGSWLGSAAIGAGSLVTISLGIGYAARKRKKRCTFGAKVSDKLHDFKNLPSTKRSLCSDSQKRALEAVGARAILSMPSSVKNNCGFEVLAVALLLLPAKLRAGRRLKDVASALAAADVHKALDESERNMLHELSFQVEDDVSALLELVAVAKGAVMSAQLDAASSFETYAIDLATPAGRVLAMLGDASSANGARYARLLRLLRLAAAAAVYERASGSRCVSALGCKPLLPPDVVDAKTEGRRVSGEVLDALLGELGFRALLLTSISTSDVVHRILLGPAAAATPFIGTLWLGVEDSHYRLVLTNTVPDTAPKVVADAAAIAAAADDNLAARGAAIGAARRLKSAADIERSLHNCAAREQQRDDASEVLARVHAFSASRSLLRWVRGGGDNAAAPAMSSAMSELDVAAATPFHLASSSELIDRLRLRFHLRRNLQLRRHLRQGHDDLPGSLSRDPVRPNALDDGDDTNLDDIDDNDIVRPTAVIGPPPEIICVLSGLDDRLADVLRAGDIKLLRVSWLRRLRRLLRQPNGRRLKRRQELEALFLAPGEKSPFLSAEEAVALLRRGNRGVGALTHCWLSPGECDPNGARLDMVLAALEEHPNIEGVFWDYASLFQNLPNRDRTPDESAAFKRAIMVMADVYASAVGTTVLQSCEIPPRPEAFDGALCLFGLKATKGEAAVRETLGCFGTIVAFEHTRNPPVVRFASHEAALAAKRAGPWPELCDGVDTLYNERAYDERGWCVFEDAVSHELLARLGAVPRVREALDALPSKVLVLRSGRRTEPCVAPTGELADRVERVLARIAGATFTGKGDKDTVPALYREYVARIVGVVQPVLALAAESAAGSQAVGLPPMPVDTGFASMRAWHLDCLHAQHAYIPDALSGQQLNTLTECVPIGVEGHDADGKPLAMRDARSLCAWLHDLRSSARTCALLTAGPAAGKTWLMSQLIMHALGQGDGRAEDDGREPLVPVLVRAEQLQKRLAEQGAAFEEANDGVEADLKLTCTPPHYAMLRAAMHERRVLLLLDGLDEAGAQRARIEKHVAEVLAPKGVVILCTSRPAGLNEAGFAGFHRLTLAPLSDEQQEAFLATRLGNVRASALKSYLRDKVPLDAAGEAGTKRRVTANPLMLSMVCSIAQLRVGIDMPTTTAELYEVAAGAMLKRSGAVVSDDARALLQATFFEAHAAEQRIITQAHVGAAAARIGMRIGMAAAQRAAGELRALVARDGLPLMRLLEAEPLQMQAFHLSFQEYYAMLAIGKGDVPLPSFAWGVWWTNAVLMGVQAGGAAFGDAFVKAAQLPVAEAAAVPAQEVWRLRVFATLVRQGMPGAWLPTALEAARGVAREAAREVGKLAAADALVVGKRVLALDVIWKPAVIARVEGDVVDVKIQGWKEKKGLSRTKALVVATDGAGALLRLAAGAGDAAVVEALLAAGVNPLVADERANTPLHRAATGGHVAVCRALVAKGADKEENNTQNQSAADAAWTAKQHAVVRLFLPMLSDYEFTDEACTRTERLRAAATGDLATLARTQDAGRMTALMVASRCKHLAVVVELLASSTASVNAQSAKGFTALYLAAEEGAEPIVQLLLIQGADVALTSFNGGTPLMRASHFGHERVVLVLLEAKADPNHANAKGSTALTLAAENGHEQVARVLLEAGAVVDTQGPQEWTALMFASRYGHEQVALVLLKAGAAVDQTEEDGWTALMFAAQNDHEQVAIVLLKAKADPNQAKTNGFTALMLAAQNGHEQVALVLLKAGAVVSAQKNDGVTALMFAAENGHVQVALILFKAGDVVSAQNNAGKTALMYAAENGHEQVALVLLEAGAVVSDQNNAGKTALMFAAENGHVQVTLVLLEAGAVVSDQDNAKCTALMLAAQNGHEQCALVLLEAGAIDHNKSTL